MHYEKDCYINERAKEDDQEPREQLQEFVNANFKHINRDAISMGDPNLNMDNEAWLIEFVRANDPYTVLETCFFPESLKDIAVNEYEVAGDEIDVVGAMLYELGFKRKVEPSGLFQIKEKLEQLQTDATEMTKEVEGILRNLFLFYSYIFRHEAHNEFRIIPYSIKDEKDPDKHDQIIDPIEVIEILIKKYRKKYSKSLGDLYIWLKDLMLLIQRTTGFTSYCNLHFMCDVPLSTSQISEIGMFRTYRNLVSSGHAIDAQSWSRHKERVEGNESELGDLDAMESSTRSDWENNWNYVVNQYEMNRPIPKEAMEERMAMFFKKFINLLSDNEIYPKVVVMREYQVDAYGTTIINAVTSDPNETIVLTDSKFFDPFSEFYYHSRTNPVGIDPILVSKLDIDEWENPPEKNQKEQGNS